MSILEQGLAVLVEQPLPKVLGPAAGSVVVDFRDVGVNGGVDFGDDGVGFSVKVLSPAACSVRVDFEDLGVDFDVVGFLVEFGNVRVNIITA